MDSDIISDITIHEILYQMTEQMYEIFLTSQHVLWFHVFPINKLQFNLEALVAMTTTNKMTLIPQLNF